MLGKVDLSAPLSKTENFRVNRVGKAQMISTKSGGTSVNLGSLIPNGAPPKGLNQNYKRRGIVKSHPVTKHSLDSQRKRKKKRDKKLKSLATTQTMSTSKMNDKKVQKMIAINADFIDKVVQNEANNQKTQSTVAVKERTHNRKTNQMSGGHKQAFPPKQGGWFSWLGSSQVTSPKVEQKQKRRENVEDPYALKPGRKMKRRKKERKRRKSRSRKVVDDINENIQNVIAESNEQKKAVDYNELGHNGDGNAQNKSVEIRDDDDDHEHSNGTPTLPAMEIVKDEEEDKENQNGVVNNIVPLTQITKEIISDLDSTIDQLDTTDLDEINSLECVKNDISKIESGRTSGNDTDLLIAEIENEIKEVEITQKQKIDEKEMDDVLQPVLVDKKEDIGRNAQTLPIFNTFD